MTSVAAELFHREHETEYYARKCRDCGQPVSRCECGDERRDQQRDDNNETRNAR